MTKARKEESPRSMAKLSTLDAFLKEDRTLEEFQATAIEELLAWQITETMKANNISRRGDPDEDHPISPRQLIVPVAIATLDTRSSRAVDLRTA
jgi:hypothetical protein